MNMTVLDTVIELVAQQFQLDTDEITESTAFEDIGAEEMVQGVPDTLNTVPL